MTARLSLQHRAAFIAEVLVRTGSLHEFVGWQWTYSIADGVHVLTAKLTPAGRGSTVEDWDLIGRVAKEMGAPLEAMPKSIREGDPNGVHRWEWSAAHGGFDRETRRPR